MKRRGFLGLLGAGVVAGPSMAQAAAKTAITGSTPIMTAAGVISDLDMPYDSVGYATKSYKPLEALERASLLKSWISGDKEPEEDKYSVRRRRRYMAEYNINSLGSISQPQKMRMMMNLLKAMEREQQRESWMEELLSLDTWTK